MYVPATLGFTVTEAAFTGLILDPLHTYVNGAVPKDTFAVRLVLPTLPSHHSVALLAEILTEGVLLTSVTDVWSAAVHPPASVTVTVNTPPTPVTVGLATEAEDNPPAGLQAYVKVGPLPPLAVGEPPRVIPVELQDANVLSGPASAVGRGLTVMVTLAEAVHPLISVTVTV